MKQVLIYCDGSSLGNPGIGGWCGILKFGDREKILTGGSQSTTNNRMELTAVIESIKALNQPCEIMLYSDSKYVCDGINLWIKQWIKKDFKNVKNVDLWEEFLKVSARHNLRAVWVKGHSGHQYNEKCDNLARQEAQKIKLELNMA